MGWSKWWGAGYSARALLPLLWKSCGRGRTAARTGRVGCKGWGLGVGVGITQLHSKARPSVPHVIQRLPRHAVPPQPPCCTASSSPRAPSPCQLLCRCPHSRGRPVSFHHPSHPCPVPPSPTFFETAPHTLSRVTTRPMHTLSPRRTRPLLWRCCTAPGATRWLPYGPHGTRGGRGRQGMGHEAGERTGWRTEGGAWGSTLAGQGAWPSGRR